MTNKVTVIIPSFGRDFLIKTLQSVCQQSVKPYEIIIVLNLKDNYKYREIVSKVIRTSPEIKIIREERIGASYARNTGINLSKSPILAFLDDDCMAKSDWIKEIIICHSKHRYVALKGNNFEGYKDNIYSLYEYYRNETLNERAKYTYSNHLYTSVLDSRNFSIERSVIMKKKIFFDISFPNTLYEDIDYGRQLQSKGIKIMYNPKMIVWHYGRTNMYNHLLREFNKGQNIMILKRKWHKLHKIIDSYKFNNFDIDTVRKINQIRLSNAENRLKKEIIQDKSVMFKIHFELIEFLSKIFFNLGKLKMKTLIYVNQKIAV